MKKLFDSILHAFLMSFVNLVLVSWAIVPLTIIFSALEIGKYLPWTIAIFALLVFIYTFIKVIIEKT